MDTEKKFRTKTGYCHILPDKIVFSRDGIIGDVAKIAVRNNVGRVLFIYGCLAALLFYAAISNFRNNLIVLPLLFVVLGIYLVYGIFKSLNLSGTPIIDRDKIKHIQLKKGTPGLSRSRFEVTFENEQSKLKKRLILLPGSMTDGPKETEKALKFFKAENLMKN